MDHFLTDMLTRQQGLRVMDRNLARSNSLLVSRDRSLKTAVSLYRSYRFLPMYTHNTGIRNESLLVKQTIFFPASSKQSIFGGKN